MGEGASIGEDRPGNNIGVPGATGLSAGDIKTGRVATMVGEGGTGDIFGDGDEDKSFMSEAGVTGARAVAGEGGGGMATLAGLPVEMVGVVGVVGVRRGESPGLTTGSGWWRAGGCACAEALLSVLVLDFSVARGVSCCCCSCCSCSCNCCCCCCCCLSPSGTTALEAVVLLTRLLVGPVAERLTRESELREEVRLVGTARVEFGATVVGAEGWSAGDVKGEKFSELDIGG